jgi:hypothetical protein
MAKKASIIPQIGGASPWFLNLPQHLHHDSSNIFGFHQQAPSRDRRRQGKVTPLAMVLRFHMPHDMFQAPGIRTPEAGGLVGLRARPMLYSDTTKESRVFMNADRAPDHSSPEFKNRDYFLGLL